MAGIEQVEGRQGKREGKSGARGIGGGEGKEEERGW